MLLALMEKHNVDSGLVTYAACARADKQRIFDTCGSEGAMYITCSREVAADVRRSHGNVMSSTGGPNTLVAARMTDEIRDAVQLSAMIENSGQCTALRHACVGGATEADMVAMFDNAPVVSSPQDALKNGAFAGIYDATHPAPFDLVDGYSTHAKHPNIAYRIAGALPESAAYGENMTDLEEQWRQVRARFARRPSPPTNNRCPPPPCPPFLQPLTPVLTRCTST
jgi:hypothetical protein